MQILAFRETQEGRFHSVFRLSEARSHQVDLGHARTEGFNEGNTEGFNEGRAQGQATLLLRLMAAKFGKVPADLVERVRQATEAELVRWSERVLTAESVEAVCA